MYNRYLQKVQDVDDYIDLPRGAPGSVPHHPPHTPPFYTPPPPPPAPPPPPHDAPESGVGGILGKLFEKFHMPDFDLDDILLLGIVFLLLRDSGDEDLLLIFAALYFLGND